jgi:ubiquinone/menaquinone biosynthesis C-methylase UbiE
MKVTMSGQSIPFAARLRSAYNIYQGHRKGQFANTNVECSLEVHRFLRRLFAQHGSRPVAQARILDLGCGQNAVQSILFHADGAHVTGIDIEVPSLNMNLRSFLKTARVNGMERALKSLARTVLFDKKFFARLARAYDQPVSVRDLDLRVMDAKHTTFPQDHFDFIFSFWVFEHIDDIDAALAEVRRILKPEGAAFIELHLFPSLSGGHNLEWLEPDTAPSQRVPPWDHLRDNLFPANVYLNKLRLADYRKSFHAHLEVVDELLHHEGETILTPELEKLLQQQGYSRSDLLTRSVGFVCKKPSR